MILIRRKASRCRVTESWTDAAYFVFFVFYFVFRVADRASLRISLRFYRGAYVAVLSPHARPIPDCTFAVPLGSQRRLKDGGNFGEAGMAWFAWFRRDRVKSGESASGIVSQAIRSGSGKAPATVISATALCFSGFSLWETSLKQADLSVYVTGVVTYERDRAADDSIMPAGGFEVLAVPITIANSGARDGVVLALQLDAKNPRTGLTARFEATYNADAAYFANSGAKRPKTPFSALVLAGPSAWTGTVLFYPVSYSNGKALTPVRTVAAFNEELRKKYASEMGGAVSLNVLREKRPDLPELAELDAYRAKVLNQNDQVEMTLRLIRPVPTGWLDRVLGTPVEPVTLTLNMPDIPGDRVARGELVRLRNVEARL